MNRQKRTGDTTPTGPSRAATLLLVGAVLGAAVVIFAWMNTDAVPVEVFLWEPEISKALLMFVPLAVGFLLGWGLRASRARTRRKRRKKERSEGKDEERGPGRRPGGRDAGGGTGGAPGR